MLMQTVLTFRFLSFQRLANRLLRPGIANVLEAHPRHIHRFNAEGFHRLPRPARDVRNIDRGAALRL